MNVLFLGDLVGNRILVYLKHILNDIKKKYDINFIIANAENVENGYGIKPEQCNNLFDLGVDVITSGNHIWDQAEILPYIARNEKLLRPLNYSKKYPGNGIIKIHKKCNKKIVVVNLLCNLFMRPVDCPFQTINKVLEEFKLKKNCDILIIDLHGEAASEKQAIANMIDGKVTAVLGTHTHVPTSDLRILPEGTSYITDAGMCGDYDSVIGGEKKSWIANFENKNKNKINSATKYSTLCGVIIKPSNATGLSIEAKQIIVGDTLKNIIPNDKGFSE